MSGCTEDVYARTACEAWEKLFVQTFNREPTLKERTAFKAGYKWRMRDEQGK